MTRLLLRLYAIALGALPPSLRREHAADMLQCARTAVAAGGAPVLFRLFTDLAVSVAREWVLLSSGVSMNGTGRDVAYALRLLWRSPGFTVAAVVTLALGIGANTAIFSLAYATLLRPLKVANPSELYMIKFSSSYPDYLSYTTLDGTFAGVIATSSGQMNVVSDGRAELVEAREGRFVCGNYFSVLGLRPAIGRAIAPADDQPNGPIVAVLGYDWWQSRFGGDRSVVGKGIRINDAPATIIGVAPKGFGGVSLSGSTKVFVPITQSPRVRTGPFASPTMLTTRRMVWLNVVVRLRPGVTPQQGAAAVESLYRQAHPLRPGARAERSELQPLRTRALGGDNAPSVVMFVALLGGVVALTLLIGCANLASLLLSRAAARRRELGVRMAIGAGRSDIVRQLIVESLVLSAIGGAAGLYVASTAMRLLARFRLPGGIDIGGLGLELDGRMLLFTIGVACATGLLFGVGPAVRAARIDVLATLRDDARTASGRVGARSALVAIQVALSAVLLIGTGLFLRSLVQSLNVPLGFEMDGVATATVNLGVARYDDARARSFYADALTRARQLPAVTAAAWTTVIPSNGSRMFTTTIEGYLPQPDEEVRFYYSDVGPDYFKTVGLRILRGRAFSDADGPGAPRVAIINEAAAKKYWGGRDALAGRITGDDKVPIQIVGIAADTILDGLDQKGVPLIYLPFAQDAAGATQSSAHLLVRTSGDVERFLGPLADRLRGIDRGVPVSDVTSLEWRLRDLVMPQRMGATLFALFGALALTLATIGVYGVASYIAALRTREIGIRIALGADRTRIRALVLRQGALPVAGGIAGGLVLAAACSRFAAAFLRGVPPRDPVTYFAVASVLATIALAATWLPARRAAAVDPIRALRQE